MAFQPLRLLNILSLRAVAVAGLQMLLLEVVQGDLELEPAFL
jgi:hypothetical protein